MSPTTKSRTLCVPDIHEDVDKLRIIEELYFPEATRIVLMGDWFDTFGQRRAKDVCQWILDHQLDERIEWLLGNHDCSYFFRHPDFRCSGYSPMTQATIDDMLPMEVRKRFKLCTRDGNFLISHAGFTKGNLAIADDQQPVLDAAFAGKFHSAFQVGASRGGYAPYGGCTWLDWNYEFDPLEQAQIIGHTKAHAVRTRVHEPSGSVSYCIDTVLRHILWIHEGKDVETVTL